LPIAEETKMVRTTERTHTPAELVRLWDESSGLDGVIAIHSTALGPGAGGCRFWTYPSSAEAAADAARLAEGMSYKNAMAGLPLGGAKAVLRKPAGEFDRDALFRAFGREVRALRGRYVTAEDVGTTETDMETVAKETEHVAGLPPREGRPGGDPSPWTARGVFVSLRVASELRLCKPLAQCTVAIQGLGQVGAALADMLHRDGARLLVADVDPARAELIAERTSATVLPAEQILAAEADIVAPCALGGVLDAQAVANLRAKVVCGAANNQLASPEDGRRLAERGVLYAPDYVVNAGGIINVAAEYLGWSSADAATRVEQTATRLVSVINYAEREGLPTNYAADELARQRLAIPAPMAA
jgi:leucine dehydrogenase